MRRLRVILRAVMIIVRSFYSKGDEGRALLIRWRVLGSGAEFGEEPLQARYLASSEGERLLLMSWPAQLSARSRGEMNDITVPSVSRGFFWLALSRVLGEVMIHRGGRLEIEISRVNFVIVHRW